MNKHGWFSERQYDLFGGSLYSTPDGREIVVSFVNDDPHDSGCLWPDIKYVGPVKEWIRRERESRISTEHFLYGQDYE